MYPRMCLVEALGSAEERGQKVEVVDAVEEMQEEAETENEKNPSAQVRWLKITEKGQTFGGEGLWGTAKKY